MSLVSVSGPISRTRTGRMSWHLQVLLSTKHSGQMITRFLAEASVFPSLKQVPSQRKAVRKTSPPQDAQVRSSEGCSSKGGSLSSSGYDSTSMISSTISNSLCISSTSEGAISSPAAFNRSNREDMTWKARDLTGNFAGTHSLRKESDKTSIMRLCSLLLLIKIVKYHELQTSKCHSRPQHTCTISLELLLMITS